MPINMEYNIWSETEPISDEIFDDGPELLNEILEYFHDVFAAGITFHGRITLINNIINDEDCDLIDEYLRMYINDFIETYHNTNLGPNNQMLSEYYNQIMVDGWPSLPFENMINDVMVMLNVDETKRSSICIDLLTIIWTCRDVILIHDSAGNIIDRWVSHEDDNILAEIILGEGDDYF